MQWLRYIFKIDGVYTDILPLKDVLVMSAIFLVLFGILDGGYVLIVHLFDLESFTFSGLSLSKYFFVPVLVILTLNFINFIHTYLLLNVKRNYQAKAYSDSYITHTNLFKHSLYKSPKHYQVSLIRDAKDQRMYDVCFMANYKQVFINHYHTVLEIDMTKKLPHIILSSKFNKQSQLSAKYSNCYKADIDGLSDLFDIYVVNETLDNKDFAFLTNKKVMQALANLVDCDMEIINNKLLCYAPLLTQDKLNLFFELGQSLKKSLATALKKYSYSQAKKRSDKLPKITGIVFKDYVRQWAIFLIMVLLNVIVAFYLYNYSSIWFNSALIVYGIISLSLLINATRSSLVYATISKSV